MYACFLEAVIPNPPENDDCLIHLMW